MNFEGALIKEQGVTFGIIIVKSHVLHNSAIADEMRGFGLRVFGNVPIVLACQDSRGAFTYSGRRDIVNFLANIDASRIPWQRYTIS